MWYWNYQNFLFVILYENRQYYSVRSWLIVALVTIFCWPKRPTFPSSWAYAKREGKCWAWRPTTLLWPELQWPKIVLSNIAYSHKEWQSKNSDNFNITIVISVGRPIIGIFFHYPNFLHISHPFSFTPCGSSFDLNGLKKFSGWVYLPLWILLENVI